MTEIIISILKFLNDNLGLVTLIVGGFAICLYFKQKNDTKRDAARIIIQEIRRAEDIIAEYKQVGSYQFAKKIIATNSWTKNINFFVGDLNNDELDKISDLYSTGEYLDNLVDKVSKITLEDEVERSKEFLREEQKKQKQPSLINPKDQQKPPNQTLIFPGLIPVWKGRLDEISFKIEPIYHSTIVWKLKKIAKVK